MLIQRTNFKKIPLILFMIIVVVMVNSCATPVDTSTSHTKVLNPDQDDQIGGSFIESSDIRTIAQQVCSELLSLPEFADNSESAFVATDTIKNSTRYLVDTDLLLKRLRLELNNYSKGTIRFFAQNTGQNTRTRILREREQTDIPNMLDEIAVYIASSDLIQNSVSPVKISVQPVSNTNLFNMNADSFSSLLRTKIKEHAGSKVLFAQPGSDAQVDYTLSGEFFVQSLKQEGIANTVEDLAWAQEHPKEWYDNDSNSGTTTVHGDQININSSSGGNIKIGPNLVYKAIDPALWNSPNVTKKFNVMLINNEKLAVLEKVVTLEEQIKTGQERANYILTGEISSLSKGGDGLRSDYVLISFNLIEPVSNAILWEYGYEVKRVTSRSVLYR